MEAKQNENIFLKKNPKTPSPSGGALIQGFVTAPLQVWGLYYPCFQLEYEPLSSPRFLLGPPCGHLVIYHYSVVQLVFMKPLLDSSHLLYFIYLTGVANVQLFGLAPPFSQDPAVF